MCGPATAPTQQTNDVVALECVAIVRWSPHGPQRIADENLRATPPGRGDADGGPLWVQLALPELSASEQSWFEGSVDPWIDAAPPAVRWTPAVTAVLEAAGLGPKALDDDEARLLSRLPFLYERGVPRTAREIWGRTPPATADPPGDARPSFFPAVSFRPARDPNGLPAGFWTVRITVAVIRNVVLTVRLPDMRRLSDSRELHYEPGGALHVPARFFPSADDITAHDLADGIALHHAATARTVAQQVREDLIAIERASANGQGHLTASARKRALKDAGRVTALTETAFHLDHQLSRLLRRIGDAEAVRRPPAEVRSEVARRYRWALDELRSLEADCRLTAEAVGQAINTHEHEERERFQFAAAVLATAILVPGFVVGLYGGDVTLPDDGGGLTGLAALIVLSAVGALAFVFAARRGGWKAPDLAAAERWRRRRALASTQTPESQALTTATQTPESTTARRR
jgi:hypothetical protein